MLQRIRSLWQGAQWSWQLHRAPGQQTIRVTDYPPRHPRSGSTEHALFDLRHWQQLAAQSPRTESSRATLEMPLRLGRFEAERRATLLALGFSEARGIPVDLFVWRTGEPEKPYLTKVGGVPHRERSRPWPTGRDGAPMRFVAQWCFLDSMDLVSPIPGDVLLLFMEDPEQPCEGPGSIELEWSRRELADPTRAADVPTDRGGLPLLHGVIHRTLDFPNFPPNPERLLRRLAAKGLPPLTLDRFLPSTRIGRFSESAQEYFGQPWTGQRLLATLAYIPDFFRPPYIDEPWPTTDIASTHVLSEEQRAALTGELMIVDNGIIGIFADENANKVSFEASFS